MRSNINRERSKEQSLEDEVRLVVIWEESQHPVHYVQGFLISGERKGDQSLEPLIIIQGVKLYQTLSENLLMISGWRSTDQVQDLRCNFLRKDGDSMNKLCLAYFGSRTGCQLEPTRLLLRQARKQATSCKHWRSEMMKLRMMEERGFQYLPVQEHC